MFEVHQHVRVFSTDKEVVIDTLREDLKPGIIVYEVKTPKGAFGGFYREEELAPITEYVTYQQWDRQASAVMRANFKRCGSSLSSSGIEHRAHSFIIEIREDQKEMIVKKGWRDAMKDEEERNIKIIGERKLNA